MIRTLAAVASDDGFRAGVVISTFGFGLRHGVDWDHIAAITDITSSQDQRRRSLLFATLYALGHASVVFVLGSLAVLTGDLLPASVDHAMERVVGVTLLLLGGYVFWSLARHGREFRMRSRWMLLFAALARFTRRRRGPQHLVEIVHDHEHGPDHGHGHDGHGHGHDHVDDPTSSVPGIDEQRATAVLTRHRHLHRHHAPMPDDPFTTYGKLTSYAVGMLHGVGAETATQVLVFIAAARAGSGAGELLLLVFILGPVTSNTAIALASTAGFLNASRNFAVYAAVAIVTGVLSITVGALFVAGQGAALPAILGG